MLFIHEGDALEYCRLHNVRMIHGEYTDFGYEAIFDTGTATRKQLQIDWESEQPYWGIGAVVSNGSTMYKSDVAAIAKALGVPKKTVKDVTFNVHEAKLMTKKQAEQKAYYLTRNGKYLWKAIRLKY